MADHSCPTCGGALDAHHRNERFILPDPVLDLPDQERSPGLWMSHDTPVESVMMQVQDVGCFIRVLLPIHLEDGDKLTYGVWLGVPGEKLHEAFAVWWGDPEVYRDLRLDGLLANTIQPWGLLGTPVIATVLDPDQTPYCTESPDALMTRILHDIWPRDEAAGHLPDR